MSIVEKARRYDEIVRLWNAELAEENSDLAYIMLGSEMVELIQDVIKDDIDAVTTTEGYWGGESNEQT